MYDAELDRFKSDVHLLRYAVERYGYQRNRQKSTRSSHVLAHPTSGDKVVVRLNPDGHWTYFSVRDDRDNGTVIDFVLRRMPHGSLGEVRKELRAFLGSPAPERDEWKAVSHPARAPNPRVSELAFTAARLAETSPYLESRGLRQDTLCSPRFAGTWRIGTRNNVLFPHRDDAGSFTGFEMKNRGFTGFSTGGTKSAWQSHALPTDGAIVIAESAIDALSYGQLHQPEALTYRYLSTAGAPSTHQFKVLERFFSRLPEGCLVIAAVDRDSAGDWLAKQYEWLAGLHAHLGFRRHSPERDKDWNDVLRRSLARSVADDFGR
jgi:hypothetical protein